MALETPMPFVPLATTLRRALSMDEFAETIVYTILNHIRPLSLSRRLTCQ